MLNRLTAFLAAYPRCTALTAGGISATGFAPLGLWPLTLIALTLLLWLLSHDGLPTGTAKQKRRAFGLGWLWGVGHFAIGLNWIATAFTFQAAMPAWLGWIAVVLLSLYLAVFPGLATLGAWWGMQRFGNLNRLSFVLLFAAAWITTEWLRSWVFTGFAWNPLAAIAPWATGMMEVVGTYGQSGLIIIVAGVVYTLVKAQWRTSVTAATVFLSTLALLWLARAIGGSILLLDSSNLPREREPTPVTIVQPNIAQGDKWDPTTRIDNFRRLARQSIREPNAEPRLLLWPEAAVPDYLEDGYPPDWLLEPASFTRARLASLLGRDDLMLTGAVKLDVTPDGRDITAARNSLFVLDAQRRLRGRYDKAHLVPYGEYLPARVILEPLGLSRLAPGATDFRHGPGPRTLDLGRFGSVGVQICYEIIFSGQVVDRTNRPDFIFNPSNDAWFGAWGPPQHLAQARLRAIEEGLPVVRATPTGISAIIAPDGRILESIPMGQAGRIDARLPLPREATLFARYGNILPLGLAVFLALAAVALGRRRR
jgi:apolipoprotein N-acyltransferase